MNIKFIIFYNKYNQNKDYENAYKYLSLGKNLIDNYEFNIEPKLLIDEKKNIFEWVCQNDAWIFYTHDYEFAASKLIFDESKQRFIPDNLIKDFTF